MKVTPAYPNVSGSSVAGTVLVHALVGRDGRVQETRIGKSIPMLDAAAEASVRQWIFNPGLVKGQPVAVWVAVPATFSMH